MLYNFFFLFFCTEYCGTALSGVLIKIVSQLKLPSSCSQMTWKVVCFFKKNKSP